MLYLCVLYHDDPGADASVEAPNLYDMKLIQCTRSSYIGSKVGIIVAKKSILVGMIVAKKDTKSSSP